MNSTTFSKVNCISLTRDTLADFEKQHRPFAWQFGETP
jgi:hypothetical protein